MKFIFNIKIDHRIACLPGSVVVIILVGFMTQIPKPVIVRTYNGLYTIILSFLALTRLALSTHHISILYETLFAWLRITDEGSIPEFNPI